MITGILIYWAASTLLFLYLVKDAQVALNIKIMLTIIFLGWVVLILILAEFLLDAIRGDYR